MNSAAESAIIVGLILNIATVLHLAWKISRFMSQIEFKVNMMWNDYALRHRLDRDIDGQ